MPQQPIGSRAGGRDRNDFRDRVLPVDAAAARIWGELPAARSLPVVDTLLAATALAHGLVLVTRDTRDVAATGVRVIDPLARIKDTPP